MFEHVRSHHIASLNIEVSEYRHTPTGARHFHLAADDRNNCFMVAFRTVPQDSTGVAHILEHTTLCGSRRFPVRDPFFMMMRRSLNTFMNAFTASDTTAYPFATQNRKDFDNLLQVYLDAVFFPLLDELDFAQEGHRIEFDDPDDPASPLVYKGVVYNEMKGAMSAPSAVLWHDLCARLFPTTTYHFNSGGDPAEIPKLRYEDLKAFHARHYHPSNAVFMTYGDLPPREHQRHFEDYALRAFSARPAAAEIPDEQRLVRPADAECRYALDGGEDTRDRTYIVLGWLLERTADIQAMMSTYLLSGVLLNNSASPLRRALETTRLGSNPSELTGLEDSMREAVLVCGLEGSNPEHAQAVEDLILEVVAEVAEKGVPREMVESILHQFELSQREVASDGFPYGLQLMARALPAAVHGGDPMAMLDIDPALERLREHAEDPAFIKGLARSLLLDNPHRVRLVLRPDPDLAEQQAQAEARRLEALKARLGQAETQALVERAHALAERQEAEQDPEILPKVGREDIPPKLPLIRGSHSRVAGMPATWYARGTNGLVHQQIVCTLPRLDADETQILPMLAAYLTELGCGRRDYLEVQTWQAVTGAFRGYVSVRAGVDDLQTIHGFLSVAGKGLARNAEAMAQLQRATLLEARFDELTRLRELVSQSRMGAEASVTDQGHILAMLAACAGINADGALSHRWDGLASIQYLKQLDDSLEQPEGQQRLAELLGGLHERLRDTPRRLLVVSEKDQRPELQSTLDDCWSGTPRRSRTDSRFAPKAEPRRVQEAWITSTQVNFCARAYPVVPADDPDGPVLAVLGHFLRNGFLHRAVREQGGAYGAGANYDSDSGSFRMFSYRDPRLGATLADFDSAVDWLQQRHPERLLEEAVLGVIGKMDQPHAPAREAIRSYFYSLHGRTPSQRNRFRQRVLGVSIADLQRVGERYLRPELANTAVIADARTIDRNPQLDLQRINL